MPLSSAVETGGRAFLIRSVLPGKGLLLQSRTVMAEIAHIDGSQGEGGGQILRTSVALSAALDIPVRVTNIRSGRTVPGLRPQHVAAVRAAATVCQGELTGDAVGSSEITLLPGPLRGGQFNFEIPTAGSAVLVCQTILPTLMLTDVDNEVTVTGGTHNPMAPCFEYVRGIFTVLASVANCQAYFDLDRAGFYPAGGGRLRMAVSGLGGRQSVEPIRLTSRGDLRHIEGISATGGRAPGDTAERLARRIVARLARAGHRPSVEQAALESDSPGSVAFVRAVFSQTVAGAMSVTGPEHFGDVVADDATDAILAFIDSPGVVDAHAADQLLPIAALCYGESHFITERVTSHLRTNAAVIEQLTGRAVTIEPVNGQAAMVTLAAE